MIIKTDEENVFSQDVDASELKQVTGGEAKNTADRICPYGQNQPNIFMDQDKLKKNDSDLYKPIYYMNQDKAEKE